MEITIREIPIPATTIRSRHRWYSQRVKISRFGYSNGVYWGTGAPLYFVHRDDDKFDFYIRGTKEYAACSAHWAENHKDTAAACAHLRAYGKF